MTRVAVAVTRLLLPAVSDAEAVRLYEVSCSALPTKTDQSPALSAVAVPITVLPLLTVTNVPASAVPVIVGVTEFICMVPKAKTGSAGRTESMVTTTEVPNVLSLPAASTVLVRIE